MVITADCTMRPGPEAQGAACGSSIARRARAWKTQLPILAGTSYDDRHERASQGMGGDGSAAELSATDILIQVALRKDS